MPISSGALEWPVSYYSKSDKDAREVIDGGQGTPRGAKKSPRGADPQSYEWQPQLTNRENYERWRKEMDRKDPLKTRRKKSNGCFGFLTSNKINTENEDPAKGEQRDSPREVIRRRRRRRCFLLACCLSALLFALMAVFVFLFLRFTGHEIIGPEDLLDCGQWRTHFLAYAEHSNGSTVYVCCYLPDVDNYTRYDTLGKSGWPDGYLIDKGKCNPPAHSSGKCEDYTTDFQKIGVYASCKACRVRLDDTLTLLCLVWISLLFK